MFKRNFLIYTLAAAAEAVLVSDIFLISFFERFSYAEEDNMYPAVFLLPAAFAAACYAVIILSARSVIVRQRRKGLTLDVRDEYSFFRNCSCLLSVLSAVNSVWLWGRFRSVSGDIYAEEVRKTNLMTSGEAAGYRERLLSELSQRRSGYAAAAAVCFGVLLAVKLVIYLFSARGMVRKYQKSINAAKSRKSQKSQNAK